MINPTMARIAPVLLLIVAAGCGGGGGLPDPGLTNVVVELGRARSAVIGPDGGTVTVTGGNGFLYTLTVPEGAVLQGTKIAVYPLTALTNLPKGATVSGGVNFAPDGLKLLIPATLTIELPASADPHTVVPIAYSGNADNIHLEMGTVNGRTITTKVYHFSGTALGNREIRDLIRTDPLVSNTTTDFQSRIAALFDSGNYTRADFSLILRNWYDLVVRPALTRGGQPNSSDVEQAQAAIEYYAWLDAILFCQMALLDDTFNVQPQNSESEGLAVTLLKRIYQFYNDLCVKNKNNPIGSGNSDVDPLFDAFHAMGFPQQYASDWHIPLAPNGLDKETLLNNLCVKVVIESKSYLGTEQDVFAPLKVKAGFTISGGPLRHDFPIQVKLSGNGIADPTNGVINNGAAFNSTVHWPHGVNPLNIGILAALFQRSPTNPARNVLADIAVFDRITVTDTSSGGGGGGGGSGIFGRYDGTVTDQSSGGGGGQGPVRIYLTQVTGGVGVEIQEGNLIGGPKGPDFTSTLSGTSLTANLGDEKFTASISGKHMSATMQDTGNGGDKFQYEVDRQ